MSLSSHSNANRRMKRGGPKRTANLLEVTARPDKERSLHLRKRLFFGMKVFLIAASVGTVTLGSRMALKRFLWENPTYALSDLRVSSDGMLTRAQVLEAIGLVEGRNIFTVDLAKVRAALDELPQVERAEVRRVLPERIEIRISERQPVAWLAAAATPELTAVGEAYLVDARGVVLRPRKVLPEYQTLPLIVGVNMEDVALGQKLPTAEALTAVELLKMSVDETRWQPRVVDVSKGYCLLVTDQRRARITFGFDALEEQMHRLRQLLETVEPMQRDLQTVNLMLERNVPVTFAPLPIPPVPPVDLKTKGKAAAAKANAAAAAQQLSNSVTADQIAKAQSAPPAPIKPLVKREPLVTVSLPNTPAPSRTEMAMRSEAAATSALPTASPGELPMQANTESQPKVSIPVAASGGVPSKLEAPAFRSPANPAPAPVPPSAPVPPVPTASQEAPVAPKGGVGDARVSSDSVRGGGAGASVGTSGSSAKGRTERPGAVSAPETKPSEVRSAKLERASAAAEEEAPPKAIPVKRPTPATGSEGAVPPKREGSPERHPSKPESQPSTPGTLLPNERLRKLFQPHA